MKKVACTVLLYIIVAVLAALVTAAPAAAMQCCCTVQDEAGQVVVKTCKPGTAIKQTLTSSFRVVGIVLISRRVLMLLLVVLLKHQVKAFGMEVAQISADGVK